MSIFCWSCAEIAFVPGTTEFGLDDDLLWLRSRRVVLEGNSWINNLNKGLGVIHHGAVSKCPTLYCGGHVAPRKESTIDFVWRFSFLPCMELQLSLRSLNRTLFFWDRRYAGVEGEVNSFATAKGAVLVGTVKRMKSSPFTFDHTQAIHAGSSKRRAPWQHIGLLGELEETSSLPWITGVGLAALYWYTQRMNRWVRGFTL